MGVAAAVAGVGAAASLAGSMMSSGAASDAASTQAAAANRSADMSMEQYRQTRADLQPYNASGQGALSQLLGMLGISGGGTTAGGGGSPTQVTIGQGNGPLAGGYSVQQREPGYTGGNAEGGAVWDGGATQIVDPQGNVVASLPYGTSEDTLRQMYPQLYGGATTTYGAQGATQAAPSINPLLAQSQGFINDAAGTQNQISKLLSMPASEIEAHANDLLPGYQFTLDQGQKSVQNAASARGLGVSGAALKGAADYATGLANTTFNSNLSNRVNLLNSSVGNSLNLNNAQQGNITNAYNRLMGVAGLGENAAATSGAQGVQAVGNATNALTSGANASAAGTIGSANAISSGLSGIGSSGMNYLLMSKLMG